MQRLLLATLLLSLSLAAPAHASLISLDKSSITLEPGDKETLSVLINAFVTETAIIADGTLSVSGGDGLLLTGVRGGSLFGLPLLSGTWDVLGVGNADPPTSLRTLDPPVQIPADGTPRAVGGTLLLASDPGIPVQVTGDVLELTLQLEAGQPQQTFTFDLAFDEGSQVGIQAVPVPGAFWLLPGALAVLAAAGRRRRAGLAHRS